MQLIRDELNKEAKIQWKNALVQCNTVLQAPLRKICRFLGEMDCLLSLAVISTLPGYTRPSYVESGGKAAALNFMKIVFMSE